MRPPRPAQAVDEAEFGRAGRTGSSGRAYACDVATGGVVVIERERIGLGFCRGQRRNRRRSATHDDGGRKAERFAGALDQGAVARGYFAFRTSTATIHLVRPAMQAGDPTASGERWG